MKPLVVLLLVAGMAVGQSKAPLDPYPVAGYTIMSYDDILPVGILQSDCPGCTYTIIDVDAQNKIRGFVRLYYITYYGEVFAIVPPDQLTNGWDLWGGRVLHFQDGKCVNCQPIALLPQDTDSYFTVDQGDIIEPYGLDYYHQDGAVNENGAGTLQMKPPAGTIQDGEIQSPNTDPHLKQWLTTQSLGERIAQGGHTCGNVPCPDTPAIYVYDPPSCHLECPPDTHIISSDTLCKIVCASFRTVRVTCEDKSNILWQAEDGTHWCHRLQHN